MASDPARSNGPYETCSHKDSFVHPQSLCPIPLPSCCNWTMAPNQQKSAERTFDTRGFLAVDPGIQLSIRPHF
ncbi:hypothetical protein EYF80_060643 [Liparis tanakae]|uniref:Uncharacterized protein n=1 Tax=Liparis tanakae TaxID=230148 RepID=A0A4Z2EK69_9TELE|nr:hypothetical protein EYF80_060643 [Liparis tanakae]